LLSLDFGEDTSKQPRAFLGTQMLEEEITFSKGWFLLVYCRSLLMFINLFLQSQTKSKYEVQSSYLNISGPIFSYIP
jgi:hypothetical protein